MFLKLDQNLNTVETYIYTSKNSLWYSIYFLWQWFLCILNVSLERSFHCHKLKKSSMENFIFCAVLEIDSCGIFLMLRFWELKKETRKSWKIVIILYEKLSSVLWSLKAVGIVIFIGRFGYIPLVMQTLINFTTVNILI